MIKASEAQALVLNSAANVEKYIALIEPNIRKLANDGKRTYECYVDGLWSNMEEYRFIYAELTPIQLLVSNKLKEFGYMVRLSKSGDTYIPRGLADDYGEGPSHVNVCLIISW